MSGLLHTHDGEFSRECDACEAEWLSERAHGYVIRMKSYADAEIAAVNDWNEMTSEPIDD